MTIDANDNTQYGMAANGTHVGSGFDVTIKRASRNTAIVNIMTPNGDEDYLALFDVDTDQDLQALAVQIGNCPGDTEKVSADDDGWETLAERWNSLEVAR